mmetsp:Transcript_20715/g.41441  ORF Transcript_20715/g.41441 Transcript_20715/m.41441 type:complete len:227 (+) Transcript_20715:84-764(+)|eukprot:CAMPEP_0182463860 /NCGR_PEP_ID=MMETSP1319-20130603/8024_1 /TAXON_ID=172717 /ORGANISM="Bolidomonas pacifica, Strain RCC208" /LENGTH=226 /DNA_ID=CAMNT_0024663451 /DNA_START=84 /DNA_END=764 /DNA_ORIENTATION=-
MDVPRRTIYVNNLNSSIKKEMMKKSLKNLFSNHARVMGIDIFRTSHLRGQAWVTLETVSGATDCLSKLQGFMLFDKAMRVQYAKEDNDRVAKKEGTYVPKELKEAREKKEKQRQERLAAKRAKAAEAEDDPAAKKLKTDSSSDAAAGDPDAPPSKRLFMPSLPLECTVDMLEVLFSPYAGYVRATMPRPGLGFCEFLDETASTKAKEALQGFKLTPEIGLEVFFGK